MRLNVAIPERHVTAPVLNAALEGVTRLDQDLIEAGDVPTFRRAVDSVIWKPEPPGEEHFDHAGVVLGRGWGDCDDLAPWHAASLRATGQDPGARAVVKKSGPKRWHAVVKRSDGSIDDPSREAGMGKKVHGCHLNGLPPMPVGHDVGSYIMRPRLALRPVRGPHGMPEAWQARADLPWHTSPGTSPGDIALVSLHASPVSSQAIVGACRGVAEYGEASGLVGQALIDRADAVADLCEGASWDEIAEMYGEEHADGAHDAIVGLFGGITKAFKSIAKPLASAIPMAKKVLPFVPGVGPAAALALDAADPLIRKALKSGAKRRTFQGMPRPTGFSYPRSSMRRPSGTKGFDLRMKCVPA